MATDNNTQPHVTDEMVNAATYAYMPFGDMYSALLAAFAEQPGQHQQPLRFQYTNWRGETAERHVYPLSVRWGATEWHSDPCWLMRAYDLDKQAEREFAMASMAIAQVASGRTAGLEAERDALAAHVGSLADRLEKAEGPDAEAGDMWDASQCADWIREQSPATCLARRDAAMKAEVLEELLPAICDVADRAEVRSMRDEHRRQAEGGV